MQENKSETVIFTLMAILPLPPSFLINLCVCDTVVAWKACCGVVTKFDEILRYVYAFGIRY